ncbi:MAG: formylglycine-generating enzyme family protein [Paludibacteraceae bacterium]|nr:formylglycine-generating enzyme family protein [Paludibacteraceae bacterium]
MKRILTLCLLAVTICAVAQESLPTIAVYVTGNDEINPMLASRLVSTIVSSHKYTAVERSAAFLTELSKEQTYQRSGAVDDDEISRLGKQFGVQFVCVASVADVWGEKYISSRIISVETGNVVTTASAFGSINDAQQLIMSFNQLSKTLVANMDNSTNNNAKKVAVYVTKTGNRDVDIILGDQLVAGFSKSNIYLAIERTNGFLSQLSKEQKYQHTGVVNDSTISRLGKQFGVQYVCVAQTTPYKGTYFINTRLVDVETASIVKTFDAEGKTLNTTKEVVSASREIANNLLGMAIASTSAGVVNETFTVNGVSFEMIYVEGGRFMMGATSEQGIDAYNWEKPTHLVTLSHYYIGKYEITQELWETVMGSNPSYSKGSTKPVENVSWNDCQAFVNKLNSLLSSQLGIKRFALPTEAQWEYAARGGKKSRGYKYSGNNTIGEVAWFTDNSYAEGSNHPDYGTHVVGTKAPNELGLYDMSGNVYEWCQDWYGSYNSSSQSNSVGPFCGSSRVLRGGGWYSNAKYCRVSNREFYTPSNHDSNLGFRVVLLP